MTVQEARAALGKSFVDFYELALPKIDTAVLQALRALLVGEGDNLLTQFGIRTIDAELQARA